MSRVARRLARLPGDSRGATIIEFAIIAPVFLLLILGLMEVGIAMYVRSVLEGTVQSAGRGSGLESGQQNQAALDRRVRDRLRDVVPGARVSFRRASYENFGDVGRPEDFTDLNRNGQYDPNECFSDRNGNSQWDSDVGRSGQGGASEVVLYTVSVTYPRFVPMAYALGFGATHRMSASTTLRNQPFATQPERQEVQICP